MKSNIIQAVFKNDFDDGPVGWYTRKNDLSTRFGLLIYTNRRVVPKALQQTIIHLLNTSYIVYSKICSKGRSFKSEEEWRLY